MPFLRSGKNIDQDPIVKKRNKKSNPDSLPVSKEEPILVTKEEAIVNEVEKVEPINKELAEFIEVKEVIIPTEEKKVVDSFFEGQSCKTYVLDKKIEPISTSKGYSSCMIC